LSYQYVNLFSKFFVHIIIIIAIYAHKQQLAAENFFTIILNNKYEDIKTNRASKLDEKNKNK